MDKSCKSCKYGDTVAQCFNPKAYSDLVSSVDIAWGTVPGWKCREESTPCGPEGKLWEPSLWYRIKTFFRRLL